MKFSPRTLTELPAGVPTPPISDAIGMPIITPRANYDRPGTSPILSNVPSATAMETAARGNSAGAGSARSRAPVAMAATRDSGALGIEVRVD